MLHELTSHSWHLFWGSGVFWGVCSLLGYVIVGLTVSSLVSAIFSMGEMPFDVRPAFAPLLLIVPALGVVYSQWVTLLLIAIIVLAVAVAIISIFLWWGTDVVKFGAEVVDEVKVAIATMKQAKADQRAISPAKKPAKMSDAAISPSEDKQD